MGQHGKRVARFVAVAGALVVGLSLFDAYPREVELRYRLGSADVQEAVISYAHEGEEVGGVTVRAPREAFDHTVSLAPGRYTIEARLREPEGLRTERRSLEVPADGTVWIDLRGPRVEDTP